MNELQLLLWLLLLLLLWLLLVLLPEAGDTTREPAHMFSRSMTLMATSCPVALSSL
jgi:hypothetical protein